VDILGELPYLIRKVLQAFIAKPFSFLYLKTIKATGEIDGQPFEIEGSSYQETTIVNNQE
jgi:hypothetical protein